MKKIFITYILILSFSLFFGYYQTSASGCIYDESKTLDSLLNDCNPKKVVGGSNYKVELGLKTKVNNIIKNISLLIGIVAVGALVYAGFLMQISTGEDEQIKKAKDIIKWTIIGFLGLISAGGIIYIVINFMYAIGG